MIDTALDRENIVSGLVAWKKESSKKLKKIKKTT